MHTINGEMCGKSEAARCVKPFIEPQWSTLLADGATSASPFVMVCVCVCVHLYFCFCVIFASITF